MIKREEISPPLVKPRMIVHLRLDEDEYKALQEFAREWKGKQGKIVVLSFTPEEYDKLTKLADFRNKDGRTTKWTVEECLKAFARACGPIKGKHWSKGISRHG